MDKNILLAKLGNNIRKYRKQAGFTQEDFALKINLDRSYYGSIERGERNLTVLNLVKIAKGLSISISHLFDGIEQ